MKTTRTRHSGLFFGASMIALVSGLSAGLAHAQAAGSEPAQVDEIVVTGFRGSLERALDEKRTTVTAVDAILAEDIGKFPDLNLSESIQRIPGVSITREGGEGRQISVRGLGPQFTRVRINGMEALASGGGSDTAAIGGQQGGGANRGRSFDFNVFASDLFNAITVRKTAESATEEGSLGATVDLQTARPFDYNGFALSASALAGYNDLAESTNPRMAAMISNTWADGTFGALLSVAYSKRKTVEEGASTVRWATGNAFAPGFESAPGGTTLAAVNGAFHPRFPRFDFFRNEQERLGVTGALQWKPTERTELTLDVLHANFKATREEQYLEAPSFSVGGACTVANRPTSCGIADTNVTAATIDSNNTLVRGTFDDVDLRSENRFDEMETNFTQISLSGSHALTDSLTVSGLIGRSKSDFENPIQTTVIFDQYNIDGYSYDFSSRTPTIGYGSANLTNPGSWTLTQIRQRPQFVNNTFHTAVGDIAWEANEALKFSAGLNYKKYEFETRELRRSNGSTTNQEPVIPPGVLAVPIGSISQTVELGGTRTVIPNYAAAVGALSLYDQSAFGGAFRLGPEPALGNNRGVNEESSGAYVQADFTTALMGMPLRGNLGIRYVKTKQDAQGYTSVGGAPLIIRTSREYTDTLPALNLTLEPRENFIIRFGAAKVMSRPDLGNLTPGATINVSGANRTVAAGNPNLNPYRAKSYDLAFEWYFKQGALLSVAFFKKDIGSLVQTVSTTAPFTGNPFGLPDSVAVAACGATAGCSPSQPWIFSTPVNTAGNTVDGFEINYQQPLTFLPGLLSNLGVLLNYTYVDSSVGYVNSAGVVTVTEQLTGLSKYAYNATLYYEDDRWSARVSAAYRDRYFSRVPGTETGTSYDGTNETLNVDASLQYTINKNFKLSLEGVNLTDEYQDQFNDSTNRMSVYHHTGREILFGVRYTY